MKKIISAAIITVFFCPNVFCDLKSALDNCVSQYVKKVENGGKSQQTRRNLTRSLLGNGPAWLPEFLLPWPMTIGVSCWGRTAETLFNELPPSTYTDLTGHRKGEVRPMGGQSQCMHTSLDADGRGSIFVILGKRRI